MNDKRWWGVGFNAEHLPSESGHYVYTPTATGDAARALKAELIKRDQIFDDLVKEFRQMNALLKIYVESLPVTQPTEGP